MIRVGVALVVRVVRAEPVDLVVLVVLVERVELVALVVLVERVELVTLVVRAELLVPAARVEVAPCERELAVCVLPYVRLLVLEGLTAPARLLPPAVRAAPPATSVERTLRVPRISRALVIPVLRLRNEWSG